MEENDVQVAVAIFGVRTMMTRLNTNSFHCLRTKTLEHQYLYLGQSPARLATWAEAFLVSEALEFKSNSSHWDRNFHHLQKSWAGTMVTFILIYFDLCLISSLPASLNTGIFCFHESFLLPCKPSFLLHSPGLPLAFLTSLAGLSSPQKLLCDGSRVTFAFCPDDVKIFFLIWLSLFSFHPPFRKPALAQSSHLSFHKSNY